MCVDETQGATRVWVECVRLIWYDEVVWHLASIDPLIIQNKYWRKKSQFGKNCRKRDVCQAGIERERRRVSGGWFNAWCMCFRSVCMCVCVPYIYSHHLPICTSTHSDFDIDKYVRILNSFPRGARHACKRDRQPPSPFCPLADNSKTPENTPKNHRRALRLIGARSFYIICNLWRIEYTRLPKREKLRVALFINVKIRSIHVYGI